MLAQDPEFEHIFSIFHSSPGSGSLRGLLKQTLPAVSMKDTTKLMLVRCPSQVNFISKAKGVEINRSYSNHIKHLVDTSG